MSGSKFKSKPIVLCDVDGVLADFIGHVCTHVNENQVRPEVSPASFTSFDLESGLTGPQMALAKALIGEPGFCSTVPWYEGSKDFFWYLCATFDTYAITAPWPSDTWCAERLQWLKSYLPREDVIFASSKGKANVCGDVMIEDNADTLEKWVERWGGSGILIDRPWNKSCDHPFVMRVKDYAEARHLLECWED